MAYQFTPNAYKGNTYQNESRNKNNRKRTVRIPSQFGLYGYTVRNNNGKTFNNVNIQTHTTNTHLGKRTHNTRSSKTLNSFRNIKLWERKSFLRLHT